MRPYSDAWRRLRNQLLERAGNQCERCHALRGFPHPYNGKTVTLFMAHLDGNRTNFQHANLRMVCTLCRLR